jgi:hypothetical protein
MHDVGIPVAGEARDRDAGRAGGAKDGFEVAIATVGVNGAGATSTGVRDGRKGWASELHPP